MGTIATALPKRWFTAGGNRKLWGDGGTYTEVAYESLPSVNVTSEGSFRWLEQPASGLDLMSFEQTPVELIEARLNELVAAAAGAGLVVPSSFIRFISDPALHARVPSCTACYFDLGARLIPIPDDVGPARLLRFMNDQQACLLWYLLLEPDGGHRVACAWPEWRDEGGDTLEAAVEPRDVAVCASSFEEFIKRFWIENTLWYSVNKGQPPIVGELRSYLDAAARTRG